MTHTVQNPFFNKTYGKLFIIHNKKKKVELQQKCEITSFINGILEFWTAFSRKKSKNRKKYGKKAQKEDPGFPFVACWVHENEKMTCYYKALWNSYSLICFVFCSSLRIWTFINNFIGEVQKSHADKEHI